MTQIGVDIDALHATASQLGAAAESFSQGAEHARGIPGAPAPLNANGLLGSMCFPSFPRFCGQLFMDAAPDRDKYSAMVLSYNY